jgi:hypothetical protein
MPMLKMIPGGSIEDAKALLASVWWLIEIERFDDAWVVKAGEQQLLITSSEDAVQTFIYGMALAYSMIPADLLDEVRRRYSP